jgi:hypothetical protein
VKYLLLAKSRPGPDTNRLILRWSLVGEDSLPFKDEIDVVRMLTHVDNMLPTGDRFDLQRVD